MMLFPCLILTIICLTPAKVFIAFSIIGSFIDLITAVLKYTVKKITAALDAYPDLSG